MVTRPKESGADTEPEAKSCAWPIAPLSSKSKTLFTTATEVPLKLRMPPMKSELLAPSRPERLKAYAAAPALQYRFEDPAFR